MRSIALVILLAVAAFPAGEPAGFKLWKASQLQAMQKQLASRMDAGKVASESLGSYGNHLFMLAHRQGNGEAELHEKQDDIFVIESGAGTLVVGGTVVSPKTTAPGEIRGPSIKGGENKPLVAGDIVHIPAGVPHQMLVPAQVKIG
ncbi:MAG: hypothetical protein M1541_00975, partial [Acidobacteria bacterium]|nr:hypothetical protein [Acidobacteriota bacterium]